MGLPIRLFIILAVLFLVVPIIFKKSNPDSAIQQAEAEQTRQSSSSQTNNPSSQKAGSSNPSNFLTKALKTV